MVMGSESHERGPSPSFPPPASRVTHAPLVPPVVGPCRVSLRSPLLTPPTEGTEGTVGPR